MKPEDFIITKKRKKYKFARFAQLDNCFEVGEFDAATRDGFAIEAPLVVELGAGTGLFAAQLAQRHPDKRFIAIDVKADRLYKGALFAEEHQLTNIYFLRAHAGQLEKVFAQHSINELWLTFPDPFPKKRHAKHRMTHPYFLHIYVSLLASGGVFHFKTDNHGLFEWSLEQLVAVKARLTFLSFDLHESDATDEYKAMTTYEQRYTAEGRPIYAVDSRFS